MISPLELKKGINFYESQFCGLNRNQMELFNSIHTFDGYEKRISTNLNINKAITASATQNEVELAFILDSREVFASLQCLCTDLGPPEARSINFN
jgi:hypothetical protein